MIHAVIEAISERVPRPSSESLFGFEYDVREAINRSPDLVFKSVTRMDGPSGMLMVEVEAGKGIDSLQTLNAELGKVWQFMAYGYFQSSETICFREEAVLAFCTVASNDSHYIAGSIQVRGAWYGELADTFERDFGNLRERPSTLR